MADASLLEARGLTYGYGERGMIFEGWGHKFSAGEIVAVTGPSGRGKSTLLYLLGLMLRPQRGTVLLGDLDTAELTDRERSLQRAHRFGFVFQDAALDPTRTVLENVVEAALYRGQRVSDVRAAANGLLERFGVALRADARPGQVSGGQAQRIALCRALLHNPSIVLADEPTGNLDPATAEQVVVALSDHAHAGSTVIVVTHDPSLVARCDRSVVL